MTSLTAKTALQIAADYGFSIHDGEWEKSLIRDSIIQARDVAEMPRSDGRHKSAAEYFIGYMACTASEIRAEAGKARQFERDAYGC